MQGLRAKKKEMTHTVIKDAATALFLERGYDEVTVEEIAAAADVSARTLFRYFPTKEHLVFGDTDEHIAVMLDALATHNVAGNPIEAVHTTLVSIGDLVGLPVSAHAQIVRGSSALHGPALQAQRALRDALIGAIATETDRDPGDIDLHLAVTATIAGLSTAMETWDSTSKLGFSEHLADVLARLRRGLRL